MRLDSSLTSAITSTELPHTSLTLLTSTGLVYSLQLVHLFKVGFPSSDVLPRVLAGVIEVEEHRHAHSLGQPQLFVHKLVDIVRVVVVVTITDLLIRRPVVPDNDVFLLEYDVVT